MLVKKAQCHIYQNMRKFINLFLRRHNCSSHLSEVKLGVLSAARSAMQGTTPHTLHKSLTLMIILPTLIITLYYNIFFLIYLSFSRRTTRPPIHQLEGRSPEPTLLLFSRANFKVSPSLQVVALWCSGYHDGLTRRSSRVRFSSEPFQLL